MPRKRFDLPPLDLIQGFEAAARTLSFTKAGEELFITQSAVSRQIRALEDHLGVALFERRPRALVLTEQGRALQRAAVELLERLQQVTDGLRAQQTAPQLTVTTTNGFASLWLIPRLRGFTATYPAIDVRISATYKPLDLERSLVDVAVRYCREDAAPPGAIRLFGEELFAVCGPALLRDGPHPLRSIADLRHHALLSLEEPGENKTWLDWNTWLAAQGYPDLKPASTLHFDGYDQLIGAAISGQGVAMGIGRLVSNLLRTGQLVAPFEAATAGPHGYYILLSEATGRRPHVQAFVDWLVREASASVPDAPPGQRVRPTQKVRSRSPAARSGGAARPSRSRR